MALHGGEIVALVGENGAGKSTLMKVLSGVYPAGDFEGEIFWKGARVEFESPPDAEQRGIAIIHQELSQFNHLSVAENLFVGHWPRTWWGKVQWNEMNQKAQKWLDVVGVKCAPQEIMGNLSVGIQQLVEIAKALSRKSEVLILDEPTSALTPSEVERLFNLLRELKVQGKGLIYISHKMEEIFELSDRIYILRDGKTVHSAMSKEITREDLIRHMVGRNLDRLFPEVPPKKLGKTLIRVKEFSGTDGVGRRIFGPLNFSVCEGEIVGFAGLLGSGRTESMKALLGDPSFVVSGSVEIDERAVVITNPRGGLRNRLIYLSEDRKGESNLAERSLEENVSLARLSQRPVFSILNLTDEERLANETLNLLSTKCTGPEQEIQNLSGGNQQKVIIGRALQTDPKVLILDEPTRGVDVGAKYEIYEILFELTKKGMGIVMISSDLPELLALCDRIVVLADGHQKGEVPREEFSETQIMKFAVG